jgi:phosphohistidine phosphatase
VHQLLLLRHAKSSWDDPKLPDHDRPLSLRGRVAAAAVGHAMRDLGLNPDVVLVSTAKRARQTLQAIEPWDETPLTEVMDAIYLADPPKLLAALHRVAETARSVLLIGHNPGLHELAILLVGAQSMTQSNEMTRRLATKYPTGALAEFSIPGPWSTLGEGGGRLMRFLIPRDLPEVAV